MNRKSKIIVSVVGIAIVLLALLGITYAYYLTRIEGNTNTNSISVTTADLKLKYGDGESELVTRTDIMPGTIIEKDFTVTNTGQSKIEGYLVVLENVNNTINRKQDVVYTLDCKLSDATSCGTVSETIFPSNVLSVIFTNDIEKDVTQYYTLTVTYKNLEDVDQSEDMGKSFSGRVNIMDGNTNPYKTGITATDNSSLVYNIINNAMSGVNGTIYSPTPLTIPGKEISQQSYTIIEPIQYNNITPRNTFFVYGNCGVNNIGDSIILNPSVFENSNNLSFLKGKCITEIDGYSTREEAQTLVNSLLEDGYYMALVKIGEETTNTTLSYGYVGTDLISSENVLSITQDYLGTSYYFRGGAQDNYVLFNNMCFRIVRIEGDGSVKLIYAGNVMPGATTCNEVGETTGLLRDDDGNTLYPVYGHDDDLKADYENYEGGLEDAIENWYTTKFNTTTLQDKIKTDKWCLGGNHDFGYDDYGNLFSEEELQIKLDNWEDFNYAAGNRVFTIKTTSLMCENEDYVESKYGTLTSDEVVLAGGNNSSNESYYLYENAQGEHWWILSHAGFSNGDDDAFFVSVNGGLSNGSVSDSEFIDARPSVTLVTGTTITGGEGTKGNPYVIN